MGKFLSLDMRESDYQYFTLLKEAVASTFRKAHPHSNKNFEDFKGQDIVNFQEHLSLETKGRISEKWFYTHIKSESGKLPRIDMLNMLSQYAGYHNWEDFLGRHSLSENPVALPKTSHKSMALFGGLGLLIIFSLGYMMTQRSSYQFCFVDADDQTPISQPVDVWVLNSGESPQIMTSDSKGCVTLEMEEAEITLVIKTPYYQQDTIQRSLRRQNEPEVIRLKKDDYALMIHYFSTANLDDWKKRREQLGEIIAEDARIFQVFGPLEEGVEMYNKEEFIDKMTMPLKSLRNIEILETNYEKGKIATMRFVQKDS
ncbi:MAG: hypothetical protein KDE26_30085 [Bacteroidetes bacterium]|nr:hypothetical protein [Bacteroidota bacterium]